MKTTLHSLYTRATSRLNMIILFALAGVLAALAPAAAYADVAPTTVTMDASVSALALSFISDLQSIVISLLSVCLGLALIPILYKVIKRWGKSAARG